MNMSDANKKSGKVMVDLVGLPISISLPFSTTISPNTTTLKNIHQTLLLCLQNYYCSNSISSYNDS